MSPNIKAKKKEARGRPVFLIKKPKIPKNINKIISNGRFCITYAPIKHKTVIIGIQSGCLL